MKQAANLENFLLRVADVPAVLDQLEKWNKEKGNPLAGRLDMEHVGMSGHSFGAITTEAVSGQVTSSGSPRFTDPRIKAAIIFSPSTPTVGSRKGCVREGENPLDADDRHQGPCANDQ